MTPVEFCYWLQGAFEILEPKEFNEQQTLMIKRHLNMVFIHSIDEMYPQKQKAALDAAHAGAQFPGGKLPAHLDASIPDSEFPEGRPRC